MDSSCGVDACDVDAKSDIPKIYSNTGTEGAYCAIDGGYGAGLICDGDTDGDGYREAQYLFSDSCLPPFATVQEIMMKNPFGSPSKLLLPISGIQQVCGPGPE